VAWPSTDAGQGLDLDVLQAVALDLREAAHLLLGEADVLDLAGRQPLHGRLDLGLGQPEVGRVPLVELAGVLAHRGVARVTKWRRPANAAMVLAISGID
jgi:hypothetical protein